MNVLEPLLMFMHKVSSSLLFKYAMKWPTQSLTPLLVNNSNNNDDDNDDDDWLKIREIIGIHHPLAAATCLHSFSFPWSALGQGQLWVHSQLLIHIKSCRITWSFSHWNSSAIVLASSGRQHLSLLQVEQYLGLRSFTLVHPWYSNFIGWSTRHVVLQCFPLCKLTKSSGVTCMPRIGSCEVLPLFLS